MRAGNIYGQYDDAALEEVGVSTGEAADEVGEGKWAAAAATPAGAAVVGVAVVEAAAAPAVDARTALEGLTGSVGDFLRR